MAIPRSNQFDTDRLRLAAWARVLGHPGRVALLEILARRTTCTCGELVDEMPLAQATVSQHLKVLKEAGLVQGNVEGPRTCYCVDRDALRRAGQAFEEWFGLIRDAETCC